MKNTHNFNAIKKTNRCDMSHSIEDFCNRFFIPNLKKVTLQ